MQIRPICTDADHAAALLHIDELMDAEAGSPEADEFDVLATLVEAYEDRHFPIAGPDPLAAIQFRMEQLGLTRKRCWARVDACPRCLTDAAPCRCK